MASVLVRVRDRAACAVQGVQARREVKRLRSELESKADAMMRTLSSRSPFPPARSSRLRRDYTKALGSADAALDEDTQDKIRSFSRRMHVTSGEARSFNRAHAELVAPRRLTASTPEAREALLRFNDWAEHHADLRGLSSLDELLCMVAEPMLNVDGDGLILLIDDGDAGQIQLIEGDRIKNPLARGIDFDPRYRGGVEVEPSTGRVVAFHVEPYDANGTTDLPTDPQRIDARHAIFVAHRDRPSQTRGLPLLAAVLDRIAALDEYIEYVETATRLQAAMAVVIKSANPGQTRTASNQSLNRGPGGATSGGDRRTVGNDDTVTDAPPGQFWWLEQGDDVQTVQGSQPTATFDTFVRKMILLTGTAATGLPATVGLRDFEKANFSVSRMAEAAAWNATKRSRAQIGRVLMRVYSFWRARAIMRGVIPDDDASMDVRVIGPERRTAADLEGVKANMQAVLAVQKTPQQVIEETGQDYNEFLREYAANTRAEAELGIARVVAPGSTTDAAAGKTGEPAQGQNDGTETEPSTPDTAGE